MTSMRHQSSVWVDQHPQRLDPEKRIRDFWVHMGRAHRAIDLSPTRPPSFCILCTKPSPQTSQSSVMWSQAGCSLVVQNISNPLSFACPNPVLETQDPPALGFIEDLHLLTTTSGAPKGLFCSSGSSEQTYIFASHGYVEIIQFKSQPFWLRKFSTERDGFKFQVQPCSIQHMDSGLPSLSCHHYGWSFAKGFTLGSLVRNPLLTKGLRV